MWRRSRADRRGSPGASRAGFTLMEAMVSLVILVIVMTVVLSLLFSMKSFAEKQQAFTAPRQTARRALDYVSGILAGAADWNQITALTTTPPTAGNPYALVMFSEWGNTTAATSRRQATYNNLTGSETGNSTYVVNPSAPASAKVTSSVFGTIGTDVISVAFPSPNVSPVKIPIPVGGWPDNTASGVDIWLNFAAGCGVAIDPALLTAADDNSNLAAFRTAVGAFQETAAGNAWVSSTMIIADGAGAWRLVQLTGLTPPPGNSATLSSDCTKKTSLLTPGNGRVVHATLKDASTVDQYFAPGGWRGDILNTSAYLIAGIDFVSFRHRTVLDPIDPNGVRVIGQLEQKSSGISSVNSTGTGPRAGQFAPGFFDPTLDGQTGSNFTPIVDNVDDFQVAYIMRDGSIWNTVDPTTGLKVFNYGGSNIPAQARTPPMSSDFQVNCLGTDLSVTVAGGTYLDAACVVGLRVTVVGRSLPLGMGSRSLSGVGGSTVVAGQTVYRYRSLAVEDHAAPAADDSLASGIYDRLRLTTTVMLRNRALGY